jgi:hypothetical protein
VQHSDCTSNYSCNDHSVITLARTFSAIGLPILPRPIKPILFKFAFTSEKTRKYTLTTPTSDLKTYTSSCKEIKYGVPQECFGTPFLPVVYQ